MTLGEDGATHQILEDLALMKALPNLTVINPCDFNQTKAATLAIAEHKGPVYLRFGRPKMPVFVRENEPFEIGKAWRMKKGNDVTIIATGHLVWEAIVAARDLETENISAEVLNIHTIKPLDEAAILHSVAKTGCVVTAEEHQINGGLGESVARVLVQYKPVPQEFIAVRDCFGESGKPAELMKKYGLDAASIIAKVKAVRGRV